MPAWLATHPFQARQCWPGDGLSTQARTGSTCTLTLHSGHHFAAQLLTALETGQGPCMAHAEWPPRQSIHLQPQGSRPCLMGTPRPQPNLTNTWTGVQPSPPVRIPQSGFRAATTGGWAGRDSVSPSEGQQAPEAAPGSAFYGGPARAGPMGGSRAAADRPRGGLPTKPAAALAAAKFALQGQESNPSFGSWTRAPWHLGVRHPRSCLQQCLCFSAWGAGRRNKPQGWLSLGW